MTIIGHEGIARALTERLLTRGQATARKVEELQNLEPGAIETPHANDIHPVYEDVVSKGRFPTWMVICRPSPLRRTVGEGTIEPQSDELQWRYPMTIMSVTMGKNARETALLRYRLMLVVRLIVLQDKILVPGDRARAVIETQDMNEVVNGEAYNARNQEFLMEGLTEFHVKATEYVPTIRGPLGQASSVWHAETKLG